MRAYDPKIPLLSIHVPKCGGSSFLSILQKWFGKNLHLHYFNEEKAQMPEKVKYRNWLTGKAKTDICIHGHFNHKRKFGVDDYYPEVHQAITFLRDPLEIQLSVFYYNHKLIQSGSGYRDGKKIELTRDVDEYLEKSNPYFKLFFPENLTSETFKEYFNDYFVHVGIMEDYQNSIDILARKLNKETQAITKENKSDRYSSPSDSAIDKFKGKCTFEYAFYNFALEQHHNEILLLNN